jgi:GT2 family glycosyltransferase
MSDPEVAIVILNWNRPGDTVACLRSMAASDYPRWRAIVVDNASSDDSVAIIRAAFPQAQVLVNERNLGFAGGVNAGIAHALADGAAYVLLLNNDTEVAPPALGMLVRAAETCPRAGILSPLILYANDGRIWFAGSFRRRFLPGVSMPGYRQRRSLPAGPVPTDYATGCAMLLRREMLQEIGLLDPIYFMYWEDLDLGERARRAGWQVLLVPSAVVRHRVSASTGEESPLKWHYMGRYLPTFYQRYYRWPRLAMLAYFGWVVVRESLRGNSRIVRPFWRGFWEGWSQIRLTGRAKCCKL